MITNNFRPSPLGLSMALNPSRQPQMQTHPSLPARPAGDSFQLTFSGGSPGSPLHTAARKGDLAAVQALLRQSAGPNSTDSDGITALRDAAISGNVATIQALLDAGATVDHKAPDNQTALSYAVFYAKPEATQALLEAYKEKGINPAEELEEPGKTLLHRMTKNSYHRITADDVKRTAEALMKAGLNINQKDNDGRTPLTLAVGYYRPNIVEGLLLAGANPNQPNQQGETPLMLARCKSYPNIQSILRAHGATDVSKKHSKPVVLPDAAAARHKQAKPSASSGTETLSDGDWTQVRRVRRKRTQSSNSSDTGTLHSSDGYS